MNLKNRPTQAKSVMQALTGLKKTESKKGVNLLKFAKDLADVGQNVRYQNQAFYKAGKTLLQRLIMEQCQTIPKVFLVQYRPY